NRCGCSVVVAFPPRAHCRPARFDWPQWRGPRHRVCWSSMMLALACGRGAGPIPPDWQCDCRVFTSFTRSLEWRSAMTRKTFGWGMALVVLVIALGMFGLRPQTQTQAQPAAAPPVAGARYTVVDSDATNLIVVDNRSNTLYFYTEEPGKEVGQELHLR